MTSSPEWTEQEVADLVAEMDATVAKQIAAEQRAKAKKRGKAA